MNKTASCKAATDSLLAGFMNVGWGGLNSYNFSYKKQVCVSEKPHQRYTDQYNKNILLCH